MPWGFTSASQLCDVLQGKAGAFYATTMTPIPENTMLAPYGCTFPITLLNSGDYWDFDLDSVAGGSYPVDDDGSSALPDTYYHLREGVERFYITDINNPAASAQAQSDLIVMFDAWSSGQGFYSVVPGYDINNAVNMNHLPGGSNVLYMDGHVEFVKLGTPPVFPGNPFTFAMPRALGTNPLPTYQFTDLSILMSLAGGAM